MSTEDLFLRLTARDEDGVLAQLESDSALASAVSPEGVSLLLTAMYHGLFRVAERIYEIRGSASLDGFESAAVGDTAGLAAWIERDPAQANATASDGFTPLHLACFFQQEESARFLLEHGADGNQPAANPSAVSPIHSAVAAGSIDLVRVLLEAGVRPNPKQRGGYTPLMGAAAAGMVPMVDLLLEHGAVPTIECDDGQTAADLARAKGHGEMAERLDTFE